MFERCFYATYNLKYVMCSMGCMFNTCCDVSYSQIRKLSMCMQFGVIFPDYSTQNFFFKEMSAITLFLSWFPTVREVYDFILTFYPFLNRLSDDLYVPASASPDRCSWT